MARNRRAGMQARRARRRVTNKHSLNQLRHWFLPSDAIFSSLKFHGNTKWTPTALVWLALCWAWSDCHQLTDAFTEALEACQILLTNTPISTYQGFMGALVRWTGPLLSVVRGVLQQRMEQLGSRFWRIDDWVPIAFDGSRSSAPRTKSNEASLCATNYGQGHTARYRKKKSKGMRRQRNEQNPAHAPEPQAWITLMWHMGLRLPWSWRLGPSNSSERAHVMDMLRNEFFPIGTLFCGDAGFIGYALWACVLECQRDFLVRVGANVRLLYEYADCRLQKRGKDFFVLCWPRKIMQANQPPLRLRLLRVRVGKARAWMLTSVLDPGRLTAKAAVRFYQLRWGIEIEFRGLKQTLKRAKLRSRNDQRLLAELDWSILAMAVAELLALKEQSQKRGQLATKPPDPRKRSLAKTVRALRACLRKLNDVAEPGEELPNRLRAAVTDDYRRRGAKGSRYRPPNTDKRPLGDPTVRPMDKKVEQRLRELKPKLAA